MTTTIRVGAIGAALIAALVATAAPASGADRRVQHFRFTSPPTTSVYEPCGAREVVSVSERGTDYFDAAGDLIRTRVHFFYDSVVTGESGRSIRLDAHQSLRIDHRSGVITLTGQSANVRAPGEGVLYQDVGRLVVDTTVPFPGETLFTSAKAVSFEAFDLERLSAAICVAVGP